MQFQAPLLKFLLVNTYRMLYKARQKKCTSFSYTGLSEAPVLCEQTLLVFNLQTFF